MWREILVDRFVVVFTVRPAIEVAWSLAVRDGFSLSLGLALWNAYYRHLAAGLDGIPAIAVDYVRLAQEPNETTAKLLSALRSLDIDVDADSPVPAGAISNGLRRATMPSDVARMPGSTAIEDLLPGWVPAPVVMFDRFHLRARPPELWEVDILEEHRLRRRVESDHDRSREEADRVRAERDDLSASRSEARTLRSQLEDAQRLADQARRDVDLVGAEVRAVRAHNSSLRSDTRRLKENVDRLAAERVARDRETDAVEAQNAALRGEVEASRTRIDEFEQSTSWRLTSPARALGRAIRRARRV